MIPLFNKVFLFVGSKIELLLKSLPPANISTLCKCSSTQDSLVHLKNGPGSLLTGTSEDDRFLICLIKYHFSSTVNSSSEANLNLNLSQYIYRGSLESSNNFLYFSCF